MRRNRQLTEQRLVDAVGQVLERDGVLALSASAVAARAGVDKALVYKYFGDLNALLKRYAEMADLWWSAEELLAGLLDETLKINKTMLYSLVLVRLVKALRRRPVALAVLAYEVNNNNILSDILSVKRERETKRLFGALARLLGAPPSADEMVGLTTYMHAITYAALLGRGSAKTVYGIELGTGDATWTRLEAAVMTGARAQFDALRSGTPDRPKSINS